MEIKHLTAEDLDQFASVLKNAERGIGKVWNPGEACDYCPMWNECDARIESTRAAVQSLEKVDETGLTSDQLAALYSQSKMLEKALKLYSSALRAEVQRAGSLPLPDGRVLTINEAITHKITDVPAAWTETSMFS